MSVDMPRTADIQLDRRWLREIVTLRWRSLLAIVLATWIVAVAAAFLSPLVYRAQVVLVPAESSAKGGALAALSGQFGGLASVAGLDLANNPQIDEIMALLVSRSFTENFIQEKALLPKLFESRWDPERRAWKPSARRDPNLWDGFEKFEKRIRAVERNKKLGTIVMTIDWTDRNEAAQWANLLVARANDSMRQRAVADADRNIQYLEGELKKTDIVGVQAAIGRLIEDQLKVRMLANEKVEFALRTVDPAMPPDEHDVLRPNRLLYIVLGPFVGLVFGLLAFAGMRLLRD